MILLPFPLQAFELDVRVHGGKEVIALRPHRVRGRLGQPRVRLDRLMVFFHFPPFLVDSSEIGVVKRQIVGDQIQHAGASVFVGKDLLSEQHRNLQALEENLEDLARFQLQ